MGTPDVDTLTRWPDEMVVATVLRWVFDDITAGVDGRWPVRRDHGRTVPDNVGPRTAWWVPTAHAARLVAAGITLGLECIPPGWLSTIDEALTGRPIEAMTLAELAQRATDGDVASVGFVKPSLAKLDALPPMWGDVAAIAARALAGDGHPDTVVEVCAHHLDLTVEYRCFVIDGTPTRPSPYRIDGHTWEPGFDDRGDAAIDDAARCATDVAATLHRAGAVPPAWVLDTARTRHGDFVIVEANAAWSSGTYGCDLGAVADAVATSSLAPPTSPWLWHPDAAEAAAAASRPLPRSTGAPSP